MVGSFFKDVGWRKLGLTGGQLELVSFAQTAPPSWESYWAKERAYWRADDPDKKRVQLYFGAERTEENLLAESKEKYESFKEYLLHWHGLCKIGESVQAVLLEHNVIALSKNWTGRVADHSDLEVWLKEEKTFYWRRKRFCCEIYSFGTLVVPEGSVPAQMGEKVGTFPVSHRQGESRDKNETVAFNRAGSMVLLGDAKFRIVG
jgi:hypothetical protein